MSGVFHVIMVYCVPALYCGITDDKLIQHQAVLDTSGNIWHVHSMIHRHGPQFITVQSIVAAVTVNAVNRRLR